MGGQKKQSKNKNSNKVNNNKHNSNSNNNNSKPATNTTPNNTSEPQKLPLLKKDILSLENRNELDSLIAKLTELGFKTPTTVNDQWELFKDIQNVLQHIIRIEQPLNRREDEPLTPAKRLTKIDDFYKWAKENDLKFDGIEIAEFDGYELGLRAARDINKDDILFTIPQKLILSEEVLVDGMEWKFGDMSNLNLVYALMLEAINPYSFWKPYIDLLPRQYNTCLYFTNEEMEMLKGSNVLPNVLKQCKSIARQYAIIYNFIFKLRSAKNVKPLGLLLKQRYSYNLYRWAVSTVMTRENIIPRFTTKPQANRNDAKRSNVMAALIPFWDMANHKNGNITSFWNAETQQMESTAQEAYQRGEQIFIYYGDRSNADLMLHNGFINATNPRDSVSIKLGLNSADALFKQRTQLLELLQIPANAELKVLTSPVYVSPELLAYVRVFNMNAAQLEHWITSERASDLLHIDCALETCLETKTWLYIQTRLMLLLRCFPTTLADDEAQLQKLQQREMQLSEIAAMLLEYRILEKRILTAALDYAQQRARA